VRYRDVLALPAAWTGYLATFAYMIGFYQTYIHQRPRAPDAQQGRGLAAPFLQPMDGVRCRRHVRQVDHSEVLRVMPLALGLSG
jgi:hypothetical protein